MQISFDGVEVNPFSYKKKSVDVLTYKIMNMNNNVKYIQYISVTDNDDNINTTIKKVVTELNDLYLNGIVLNNEYYNVYLLSIVTDMVAIYKLLKLHNFIASDYPCRTCNCRYRNIIINNKSIKVKHTMRGFKRKYHNKYTNIYKYRETKVWQIFNNITYLNFLKAYNRKHNIQHEESEFFNLIYFTLDVITFDAMHTVCNGLSPFYDGVIKEIYSNYNISNFRFVYCQSSTFYDFNLLTIQKYNIIQTNFIILNILPLLLLSVKDSDHLYNSLFNLIDIVNNCLWYNFSNLKIRYMENILMDNMIMLEMYYNFTPSMHNLIHIVRYLKAIGPLAHQSTSVYERSYKQLKAITYNNQKKKTSIINTMTNINQLCLYNNNYYNNSNKLYKIIANQSTTIKKNFESYTSLHSYFIISYLNKKNSIRFGIIRKIDNEEIYVDRIYVKKISFKIYKFVDIINNNNIKIDINKINIFNNIYFDNNYYFFISDFIYYSNIK